MTVKQQINQRAKAFAREVITEDFKQAAPDALVVSVARKVSRAMPISTLEKLQARRQLQSAE